MNYANGSAVYWIKDVNGKILLRWVSSADDFKWSVITRTTWPELNIVNFLQWILESGNVTEVRKLGDSYEFYLFLRAEYESNAGTIEDPHIIKTVKLWNVTLVVNGDGKPLGGHISGKDKGPSNVYGANWLHEGNFTLLGQWG